MKSAMSINSPTGCPDNGYHLYCLDLTTDLGIPVIAAVAIHTTDPKEDPLIGLGAHLDIQIALIRSLSELGQSWNLRSTFQVNKYFQQMCGRLFSDMEYIHPDSAARLRSRHEFTSPATEDFLEDIEYCVDLIKEKNMEMFAVDLTRAGCGPACGSRDCPGPGPFLAEVCPQAAFPGAG